MKKGKKLLAFLMVSTLLLTAFTSCVGAPKAVKKEESKPIVGFIAPDFTLKDLKGKSVKLSDFRGQPVFLNFWATWCPPCRAEMPVIQKLSKGKKVKVLTVNLQEEGNQVEQFLNKHNYTFFTLLDTEGKVANMYGIRGIPTTFLLNKEGRIVDMAIGSLDDGRLEKMLDNI